ncbi:MAG: asparagine synthase (glutamine-hydrolyzing) [Planctomycetota bacterium]|nr:asparagine synthase (glutamine-hydrolyzing) [Planctomycetota bacterium]
MCGIIGYSGRFEHGSLEGGIRAMSHRGPDDSGSYFNDGAGVGLGHARLSIIDLSPLGHQPMQALDGAVQLVFNGEIYNYRELRKELEAKGHTFRGHSDTEVILHLYLEEGEKMLSRLNGIFTVAFFDARTGTTLVARDALGVKPLYYTVQPQGIAFASEIKGLLRLVPGLRELDVAALHRYLSFLWCPGEGTPLKAVRKLLPGEAMVLRDGAIERRFTWYQLPAFRGVARDLDERASVEGTERFVRAAVQRQMVADVPVGAFLSGGLDSSAVVAFARETAPDLQCFTIRQIGGAEQGVTDDLPYAEKVAKHLGVRLHTVEIEASRMAGDLERMIWQLDEPLADPAPLNVLYICELARKSGMKVLLSGAGGDDLFTGYRRHRAVELERWWSWLPAVVRRGLEGATSRLDQRRATSRRLAKLFDGAGLSGDERIANYFRWAREDNLLSLYTPAARAALGGETALAPMLDFMRPLPASLPPLERMLALEQRFFLADHNLPYTDKMSMAVGVEVRVPLLDLELVDFAARIPTGVKQKGGVGKWVFKKAMEPYLPHDVIYRPKSGFGAPLRRWMQGELRPLVGDLLGEASLRKRGLFDPVAVSRLIEANQAGRVDANYTLLSLLSIEIWCRRFIDSAV